MHGVVRSKKTVMECIDCGSQFGVMAPIEVGMRLDCPQCGAELEVISVDPIELDWAYDEYEDNYDEYEDEELGDSDDEGDDDYSS
jgi:alpha-aminoadipate carrier protein LysW